MFLCLAALYESWTVPFAVMLVVPLGILGALLLTGLRGLSNDVYLRRRTRSSSSSSPRKVTSAARTC